MKKAWHILIILPFLSACEKELDFKYHKVESQFVIEGNLTEEGAEVVLTYTIPMDDSLPAEKIVDAEVILEDLTDNISYRLKEENGIFRNNIPGIPDHTYNLTVNHGEKTFISSCLMRQGVEIVDLKFEWIKMPYDHVAVLEIQSTVSKTAGSCYWTQIYRNDKPYKWLVSHGSGAMNGILSQTTFTTRQDLEEEDEKDMLIDGDVVKVVVLPISLEMYDYLSAISSDSNGPSMFSGDYCLGYFLAAEKAQSSITFHPSEIPYYQ